MKDLYVDRNEQLALFESIINSSDDAIITKTLDGFITSWNKGAETIFGFTGAEVIGKHISVIIPDDRLDEELEIINKIKAGEKVLHYETERRRKDGSVFFISLTISPLKNKDGIVGASKIARDITYRKREEHRLKLLESVITNTTDAILITEAEPFDEPGPRIVYVNEAFTRMTGYTAEEVIGKTPRILQGPKTDKEQLKKLSDNLRNWQPSEMTLVNYKKSGEEFWINFTLSPVADEKGWYTHWISIDRDVTERKNYELQKELQADLSVIFNEPLPLNSTLDRLLERISIYCHFVLAEIWLIGSDNKNIKLASHLSSADKAKSFCRDGRHGSCLKGEGLPGVVWASGTTQIWENPGEQENFLRRAAAARDGLTMLYGIPLEADGRVIGVLLLGSCEEQQKAQAFTKLFSTLSSLFGREIKRKQLEQELNQIFYFAPDIICTANDQYFTKVNPAMCRILEYSETELLTIPLTAFLHPGDLEKRFKTFESANTATAFYFENRFTTKTGKVKWIAWTTAKGTEEGVTFSVGKDITEKKELETLLNKATTLARIGGWEIDLLTNNIYWSAITKEIHETPADYIPQAETSILFYKEGESRDLVVSKITEIITTGLVCDVELQIITAKGNTKWVRVIGEGEYIDNRCIRVYGSFQDIDALKKAEIAAKEILEERNTILESIDDAFFAVDKSCVVTYWNNMAETILGKSRIEMVNHNLWEVFPPATDSETYKQYQIVIDTNQAVHFEDYNLQRDRWFEISAYPSPRGLSVYFKDISARKKNEGALKNLNKTLLAQSKELKLSNSELEQFAYVASHDLQEPLRMVTSFLSQLEKKYSDILDDKGRKYLYFAVDGAKRMRQIILDLLEFSRVGRTEYGAEDIDLVDLMDDILVLFRKKVEETQAVFSYSGLPIIKAYKAPVRQVFQNLIGNSLKYQAPGSIPDINISYTENSEYWQFAVTDNGIGIDAEYFEKIFIIFQRLHNKDEYSGTGMGLAVTKKIIESLNGKIWVKSTEGKGSTFYFTIAKNLTQ